MTHFKWLKKEVPRWVKEEIITREAGDSLISLYRNEERHSHGEGLFVLAAVCFLTGLIFICAGVWNGLSHSRAAFRGNRGNGFCRKRNRRKYRGGK